MECTYIYTLGNKKGQICKRPIQTRYFCQRHNPEDKKPYEIKFADFLEVEYEMKDEQVAYYLPKIYDYCQQFMEAYFKEETNEAKEGLKEDIVVQIKSIWFVDAIQSSKPIRLVYMA